ncbi:MAG: cellulase family glycosylhydrolase [Candidatus Nealsonbacteria bacterium]|nr:cellulase family glycosylhydrolase [Candidatus Nealsonbacteria bacterium]
MRRAFHRIALIILLALPLSVSAADWQMQATGEAALEITLSNAPVVTSGYCFWGENWNFAGADLKLGTTGTTQTFVGTVAKLGLKIDGTIASPAPGRLKYTWNIDSQRDLKGIIGGGLEFQLVLDSPALDGKTPEPVLLPNNTGWRWPLGPGQNVTVEFDRPIANVYFERGQKNQIRAMMLGPNVPKGRQTIVMTVTLPAGGQIARTLAQRYGPADTSGWYAGAMRHDCSPIDMSFLNHKPAGSRGPVRAERDRLVFADGTEARFWGGNIAAYAIFDDEEHIRTQARRIAQLGYNLMRIHHQDSMSWVGRTVIDKGRDDSQHLDAQVMDRLDYWIKCLKDEGVYVWLDLHVGRTFKPGDAIGDGYAEMARRGNNTGAEGKGFCYFNERIELLMQQLNEKYLNHVNRYTRLAYKDDPAIMGLLLTNENDITCHFGNLMLPDKNNPVHNKRFDAAVRAFAARHNLPYEQTWHTWEPGPAKLFLADWEHGWNRRMLGHLRKLGVKVPVSTTQMWGGMNLCGLPPLTAGGIIDTHSYGKAEALSVNPRYKDNYVTYVATGAAYGKPLAITEWNVPYPAVDRFTAPLYVAAVSALQGWDAPMIYNYSQRTFGKPDRPGTWSTFPDPALSGMMPAAAILYRQAHVAPAKETYCLMFDRQKLYYEPSHPKNLAALRTLVEQSRVTIGLPDVKELDWDAAAAPPEGVKLVTELDKDFIPAGQDYVRSDTGELSRNWVQGAQAIDTPQTQAVHGWIGGKPIRLKNVTVDVATPKAAVAVTSLDAKPIAQSGRLLITAIARVVASPGGRMPLLSEPVEGELSIEAPPGMKLIPLDADGTQLDPLPAAYTAGRYSVGLPGAHGTHWFLLFSPG